MKLTEKQKNCPYCHESKMDESCMYLLREDAKLDNMKFCKMIGTFVNCVGFSDQYYFCSPEVLYGCPIKFCPICGRPLNKVPE